MSSILEDMQIKYKGFSQERTFSEKTTRVTYQGSKESCESLYNNLDAIPNQQFGTIDSVSLSQDEGNFWNLDVVYKIENADGSWSVLNEDEQPQEKPKGTNKGPEYSELTVRMMSRPIEQVDGYRLNWNNNLYCTRSDIDAAFNYTNGTEPISDIWYRDDGNADGGHISLLEIYGYEYPGGETSPIDNFYYALGKSYNDLPALPANFKWYLIRGMRKPNVESFDYPVYELTEVGSYKSKVDAQWAVTEKAGKIVGSSFVKNDFGVTYTLGGDWLCEGGSISKQGKWWVATLTYIHSGDSRGWDKELYEEYGVE